MFEDVREEDLRPCSDPRSSRNGNTPHGVQSGGTHKQDSMSRRTSQTSVPLSHPVSSNTRIGDTHNFGNWRQKVPIDYVVEEGEPRKYENVVLEKKASRFTSGVVSFVERSCC